MKGLLPFAALCLLPPVLLYGLHRLLRAVPGRGPCGAGRRSPAARACSGSSSTSSGSSGTSGASRPRTSLARPDASPR